MTGVSLTMENLVNEDKGMTSVYGVWKRPCRGLPLATLDHQLCTEFENGHIPNLVDFGTEKERPNGLKVRLWYGNWERPIS